MAAWKETHGDDLCRMARALALGASLLVLGAGIAGAEVRVNVAGGGAVSSGAADATMASFAVGVATPVADAVEVGGEGFVGTGFDGDMAAVTGAGRYRLPEIGWLQPSLGGGLGWYRVENCNFPLGGCDPAVNGFGFNMGGGIDVPIYRDWITLGLDARWHHAFVGRGFDAGTALLNVGFLLG